MGKGKEVVDKIAGGIKDMVEREIKLLANKIDSAKKDDGDAQIVDPSAEGSGQQEMVDVLVHFWIDFCKRMQTVRDVFVYLERTYLVTTGLQGKHSFW